MSSSGSNVFSFPGADKPGGTAQGGATASLVDEIRAMTVERVGAAAASGFDKIIDELYDLAEHALERDTRDFYLRAKDQWPGQRQSLESALKTHLAARFDPVEGDSDKETPEFSQTKSSWTELSLVDDGVLEEDMRFTEMAGRIRNGADEELAALDQRMAEVLGKSELPAADNPLAPSALATAFREALAGVEFELKVKLLVIRAYDDATRPAIIKLYKDVNTLLKDKGILPTVRYGSAKKPQTGTGPMTGPKTEGAGPQVVGSVTLPIVSGGAPGAAGIALGVGAPAGGASLSIPLGAPGAPGAGAGVSLPAGTVPASAGGMPAGAGLNAPPGAQVQGGAGGAGAAAVPGAAAADGSVDAFAMLQQLLMMNVAAGRLGTAPGGVPGTAPAGMPFAPGTASGNVPAASGEVAPGSPGTAMGAGTGGFPTLSIPGVQGAGQATGSGAGGGQSPGAYPTGSGDPAGGTGAFPRIDGLPGDGAHPNQGPGSGGAGTGMGGFHGGGGFGPGSVAGGPGAPQGGAAGSSATYAPGHGGGPSGFAGGGYPGGAHPGTGQGGGGTGELFPGGPGGGAWPQGNTGIAPSEGGIPAGSGAGGGFGPAGSGAGGGFGPAPGGGVGNGGAGHVTPSGFPAPHGAAGLAGSGGAGEITGTFRALAGLMSDGTTTGTHRVHTGTLSAPGGMPGGLIGSLTRLQQGDIGAFPDVPADVGSWLAARQASLPTDDLLPPAPNVLRALKSTSLGQQMGQMDTVTLDIVAMLFDQIFGDARIPPAMKALIGRLQIPMLKVAVLDKTFFSRKSHPARHMLDTLGELSLGLGEGFGPGTPLYRRIETTLTQLVEQFEEDFGVFDRISERFQEMIRELNQTADTAGRKDSKRIQDKERLEVARLFAQNELKARIEGVELPRAVLRFLSTEWMKLLILAYAKGGRESRAWTSLVETLDILVWSLTPKHTVDERKRLVSILPGLLKRLAKGMDVIGTDKLMRERFNAVLMRCHARTIAGGTATSMFQKSPPAPKPAPKPASDAAPAASGKPSTDESTADAPNENATPVEAPWPVSPELSLSGLSNRRALEAPRPPAAGDESMVVEEVSLDIAMSEVHDITEPMPESAPEATATDPGAAGAPPPRIPEPTVIQEELAAEPAPEVFPAVKVKNPFGDGEIEVEEVSFSDLPGFSSVLGSGAPVTVATDEFTEAAARLKEGDWVEIQQEGREVVQARLSFVSPYRSTFVFSNRKGQKVAEYSSYQVTSYLRNGRLSILEETPLFDRAFGNLVNILRKGAEAA